MINAKRWILLPVGMLLAAQLALSLEGDIGMIGLLALVALWVFAFTIWAKSPDPVQPSRRGVE